MKKTLIRSVFVFCVSLAATAQGETHGYGFMGGTFSPGAFRYGVGGNVRVAPQFTVGGEIGGANGSGVSALIISGNLGLHFLKEPKNGWDPFFTGGITGVRGGGEGDFLGNIGGGLNCWMRERVGFRAEFRGYFGDGSFTEIRAGICFR